MTIEPRFARRTAAVVGIALGVVLTACGETGPGAGGSSGGGACAFPIARIDASQAAAGDSVEVSIRDFVDGCQDTQETQRLVPIQGADITFVQEGRSEIVGSASATGLQYLAETVIRIPAWAVPGPASVQVERAEAADIVITG